MKFNSVALSTLYFKVSVKRSYSNEEICLLIAASDYTKTNKKGKVMLGKTLYFRELPLNTEQSIIDSNIESITKLNNYSVTQCCKNTTDPSLTINGFGSII
jgi:hypothetical protein